MQPAKKPATKTPFPIYAASQVEIGDFSLFGELSQNRRGPYVSLTEVTGGERGGTIQVPVSHVGGFIGLLKAIVDGSEAASISVSEDRTIKATLLNPPGKAPHVAVSVCFGDRQWDITILAAAVGAVEEMMTELARASVDLPELPPPAPRERREARPPCTQPAPAGTGTWVGKAPPRRKEKPQVVAAHDPALARDIASLERLLVIAGDLVAKLIAAIPAPAPAAVSEPTPAPAPPRASEAPAPAAAPEPTAPQPPSEPEPPAPPVPPSPEPTPSPETVKAGMVSTAEELAAAAEVQTVEGEAVCADCTSQLEETKTAVPA